MISPQNISRMIKSKSYRPLIQRILGNGRCYAPAVISRLCQPPLDAPAALGLALQRTVELTYSSSPLIDDLVYKLLKHQNSSGFFGRSASPELAASAIALRGLQVGMAQFEEEASSPARQALDRGMATLIRLLNSDAVQSIDHIDTAVILWQLGDLQLFRVRVDIAQLLKQLKHAHADLADDDILLPGYAQAVAA